ncbi:MAG: hypothetical protein Q7K42_02495, partial [Candidatus Diapherotrites archaeon]|nr:hypothetical protein [Candidatus Diapherotrites archaeon]
GSTAVISELVKLDFNILMVLVSVALISSGIAFFLAYVFSIKVIKKLRKIPQTKMNFAVLIFLLVLILFSTNLPGLVVLAISTCIGLIPLFSGIKKSTAMAFLIVPTIFYYLNF